MRDRLRACVTASGTLDASGRPWRGGSAPSVWCSCEARGVLVQRHERLFLRSRGFSGTRLRRCRLAAGPKLRSGCCRQPRADPVDGRAVAGRLRRHLTASASATCCGGRRPRHRRSRTRARCWRRARPQERPQPRSMPPPRNPASQRRRKSARIAVSVLVVSLLSSLILSSPCPLSSLVSLSVVSFFRLVIRISSSANRFRVGCDDSLVQRPRLHRSTATPESRLGSRRPATGAACRSGSSTS